MPDEKHLFTRSLWDTLIHESGFFVEKRPTQFSDRVHERIAKFAETDAAATAAEIYDFMASIANEPCPDEISSFVREVFNVKQHYVRPE